jgi:hypothetical protein
MVRRDSTSSVRYRRAMMLLATAGGNTVPVIAHLVQTDEETVRDVTLVQRDRAGTRRADTRERNLNTATTLFLQLRPGRALPA